MSIDRVRLGDLEVSAQGLGCMGMSEWYGEADWDESMATIHRALELGVTLPRHRRHLRRRATTRCWSGGRSPAAGTRCSWPRSSASTAPAATRPGCCAATRPTSSRACDGVAAAARRRDDRPVLPAPPAAERRDRGDGRRDGRAGAARARCGTWGCPRSTSDLLRRAHAVHPITAVQSEYSLWTRDPETTSWRRCASSGVGLVPYSPLGRGFLTGTVDADRLGRERLPAARTRASRRAGRQPGDRRRGRGRWPTPAGVAPAQVALAWVHGQGARLGVPVAPIPGTKRVQWLEQNVAALEVGLTEEELAVLDGLAERVVGARY